MPLPDENELDELITDVWNMEAVVNELGEDALDEKPEQADTDDTHYVDSDLSSDDLSIEGEPVATIQAPLPTEGDLDDMLLEIRELQQDVTNGEDNDTTSASQEELQAILSSIPSFSDMNKKKPK